MSRDIVSAEINTRGVSASFIPDQPPKAYVNTTSPTAIQSHTRSVPYYTYVLFDATLIQSHSHTLHNGDTVLLTVTHVGNEIILAVHGNKEVAPQLSYAAPFVINECAELPGTIRPTEHLSTATVPETIALVRIPSIFTTICQLPQTPQSVVITNDAIHVSTGTYLSPETMSRYGEQIAKQPARIEACSGRPQDDELRRLETVLPFDHVLRSQNYTQEFVLVDGQLGLGVRHTPTIDVERTVLSLNCDQPPDKTQSVAVLSSLTAKSLFDTDRLPSDAIESHVYEQGAVFVPA